MSSSLKSNGACGLLNEAVRQCSCWDDFRQYCGHLPEKQKGDLTETDALRERLLDPLEWESKARELFQAAAEFENLVQKYWNLPSKERPTHQPYLSAHLMLSGFAVENMLKAIIVAKQNDALRQQFKQKSILPKILQTHDLVRLFGKAGIRTNGKNTITLLKRLTRCATCYSIVGGQCLSGTFLSTSILRLTGLGNEGNRRK